MTSELPARSAMWRYRGTPFSTAPALHTARDTPRMAFAPNLAATEGHSCFPLSTFIWTSPRHLAQSPKATPFQQTPPQATHICFRSRPCQSSAGLSFPARRRSISGRKGWGTRGMRPRRAGHCLHLCPPAHNLQNCVTRQGQSLVHIVFSQRVENCPVLPSAIRGHRPRSHQATGRRYCYQHPCERLEPQGPWPTATQGGPVRAEGQDTEVPREGVGRSDKQRSVRTSQAGTNY